MIKLFNNMPLGSSNAVDRLDVYEGDGVNRIFQTLTKTVLRLANKVTAAALEWFRGTGTLTVDTGNNTFTTSTAPANGSVVLAPGITRVQWRVYTRAADGPISDTKRLVLADIEEIGVQAYRATDGETGLVVSVVDNDPENGALAQWITFAPELLDGTPGTFGAAGAPITLPEVSGESSLSADADFMDTSITVADGSQFQEGVIICVGYGTGTPDYVRVTDVTGNVLTITELGTSHSEDEPVFEVGWPFYAKCEVPEDTLDENASLIDLSIDVLMDIESR